MDKNLDLILGEYQPSARCGGPFPDDMRAFCGLIISDIPVSKRQTTFGPRSGPAVHVVTPKIFITRTALGIKFTAAQSLIVK